jgi:hypothetical protein
MSLRCLVSFCKFVAVRQSLDDAVDRSSTGTRVPKMWALFKAPTIRRIDLCKRFRRLGLDIAKSIFQVHGVNANGLVVIRRQLREQPMIAHTTVARSACRLAKPDAKYELRAKRGCVAQSH